MSTNANKDNGTDIGRSNSRFKDLYLSGGAYIGGTGAANKLDDYEEGTFTPVLNGVSGWGTASGKYTKVGDLVSFFILFSSNSGVTGTATYYITGLPFTQSIGERASNVSVSRTFGVDFPQNNYIGGVTGTQISFSYIGGDNNYNNFSISGSTVRLSLGGVYKV